MGLTPSSVALLTRALAAGVLVCRATLFLLAGIHGSRQHGPAFTMTFGQRPSCGSAAPSAIAGAALGHSVKVLPVADHTQSEGRLAVVLTASLAVGAALGCRRNRASIFSGRSLSAIHAPGRSEDALTKTHGLNTGIVGLPNVGKSTLFNALCDQGKAEAANFPFCTIDPNMGRAVVPDKRLESLATMAKSKKTLYETIEYVDIAGLVKGAAKGEGLGNKFLGNIRNVDAIVHVVRCFEDVDVVHVDGSVDPARDIDTITLELIFADADQIENRMKKLEKDIKVGAKREEAKEELAVLTKLLPALEAGKPARTVELEKDEEAAIKSLGLITRKPLIYAANVSEDELATGNDFVEAVREIAKESGDQVVTVSAQVEAELNEMEKDEAEEYLESLGVEESGCESLVQATYRLLGLRTYFTVGPEESRAWTIRAGWKAPKAAGVIHTDFEKGFIKADCISHETLLELGSEEAAKKQGLMRMEGKEYEVQEGDVMHFRFNV